MLIDLLEVEDGTIVETDICIVGSGAAGLAMADALGGSGLEVTVLEAGGREYDDGDQAIYDGELAGIPYLPLDSSRLRYFGGTTNHWAGYCTPYRHKALEPRPWVAGSGWPITQADVDPYVARAARLIGLPEAGWDADYWLQRLGYERLPLRGGAFDDMMLLIRPARFAREIGPRVEADPDVSVYLHANLVGIETDEGARTVTGMVARTRQDGREIKVRARRYVLAAGGIENARILLLNDQVQPGGLGNGHDLVGRYFSDHIDVLTGVLRPADPGLDIDFYLRTPVDGANVYDHLDLPYEAVVENELLPISIRLAPDHDPAWMADGTRSARRLFGALRRLEMPDDLGRHIGNVAGDLGGLLGLGWRSLRHGGVPLESVGLKISLGPAPNRDSRITLIDDLDELGQRRVQLDWRLSPIDKRSMRFVTELFAAEAGAAGLGRVQVQVDDDDDSFDDLPIEPSYHHMCTTRMADDPRHGVVDANGRVHGIDNLYCAGSSVFSTSGDGTPTMMITALALRLADHLKELAT